MHGFAGQILWVDLSKSMIEKRPLERTAIREYLGGRGINAKLLWDLARPGIDPLGRDNPLIFGTGVLAGTFAPSSGRMTITCKSPATNLYLKTNVGSHFAPELKFAGYDFIVVTGQSAKPVYLWIDSDRVELRSASHLWGLDTREADRLLKEELDDKERAEAKKTREEARKKAEEARKKAAEEAEKKAAEQEKDEEEKA